MDEAWQVLYPPSHRQQAKSSQHVCLAGRDTVKTGQRDENWIKSVNYSMGFGCVKIMCTFLKYRCSLAKWSTAIVLQPLPTTRVNVYLNPQRQYPSLILVSYSIFLSQLLCLCKNFGSNVASAFCRFLLPTSLCRSGNLWVRTAYALRLLCVPKRQFMESGMVPAVDLTGKDCT